MIAIQKPQTIGRAIFPLLGVRAAKSLPTWSALTESPESADDSSPGSASLRAQPWVEFPKSPSADREAARPPRRNEVKAGSAKLICGCEINTQIQHGFTSPTTHTQPILTLNQRKPTTNRC